MRVILSLFWQLFPHVLLSLLSCACSHLSCCCLSWQRASIDLWFHTVRSSSVEAAFHGPVQTLSFNFSINGSIWLCSWCCCLPVANQYFSLSLLFLIRFWLKTLRTYSVSAETSPWCRFTLGAGLGSVSHQRLSIHIQEQEPCCQFVHPSPVVGVGVGIRPRL